MTDEFTIQCESCGTYYNDLQEVCPYCGAPQPIPPEEMPLDDPLVSPQLENGEIHAAQVEEPHSPVIDDDALPREAYPVPTHQLLGQAPVVEDAPLPEEEYLPYDDDLAAEDPFVDDDIFAVAGEDTAVDDYDLLEEYDEAIEFRDDIDSSYDQQIIDPYGTPYQAAPDEVGPYLETDMPYPDDESSKAPRPQRFTFRHIFTGCLGILICFGLFYGGIAFLAVRQGLQERTQNAQIESQQHYQKGREHLANNSIELAIAEFEQALSLNPNFLEARQALREAQRIAQSQPTPTSQTRSAAVAEFLAQAEAQINEQNWPEAAQFLLQVRGVDPDYEPAYVSELLYTTYYQLGLQFVDAQQLEEAKSAFEQALAERPDDLKISVELSKVSLYLDGVAAAQDNLEKAVETLSQLYELDESYLDTEKHLWRARELFGDELAQANKWCKAQTQYLEANIIQSSDTLDIKAKNAGRRCAGDSSPTPTAKPTTSGSTTTAQATAVSTPISTDTASEEEESEEPKAAGPISGRIYYSMFNPNESRWEIVSVPAGGGEPKVAVTDATMPAVSPNGQLLLYHTELIDTEGLHVFDLTSGEDKRITRLKDHILPRWGGSNDKFLFTAQEAGTGRWQIQQGFADGKSNPIIFRDGRTPDWSAKRNFVAFQGTDAEGNNPGIYLIPLTGGEPTRVTTHESDRSPVFSPDGLQLAYMSTGNGNWDIYVVETDNTTPRQITTSPGNDGLPAWSPDGTRLAYVSDTDGSWAIYVIDAVGGTPVKITEWDAGHREDWLTGQIWWAK